MELQCSTGPLSELTVIYKRRLLPSECPEARDVGTGASRRCVYVSSKSGSLLAQLEVQKKDSAREIEAIHGKARARYAS